LPTYEYRCEQCGNQYDKREGFDAPSLQTCPQCSGTARRVFHAPPIVFKGSGFYNTDNKRTTRADVPAKSDGDSSSGSSDSSNGKSTESKSSESKSTDSKASTPAATE
jgi:putative FmdB family regulatory protein